jgi:hypothetical protein
VRGVGSEMWGKLQSGLPPSLADWPGDWLKGNYDGLASSVYAFAANGLPLLSVFGCTTSPYSALGMSDQGAFLGQPSELASTPNCSDLF